MSLRYPSDYMYLTKYIIRAKERMSSSNLALDATNLACYHEVRFSKGVLPWHES